MNSAKLADPSHVAPRWEYMTSIASNPHSAHAQIQEWDPFGFDVVSCAQDSEGRVTLLLRRSLPVHGARQARWEYRFSVASSLEWAHDIVWNDTDDWETVSFSHGPNATLLILERHPVMGPRWPDEVIPVEVFPDVEGPGARGLEAVPLHGENLRRQREERRVTADGD